MYRLVLAAFVFAAAVLCAGPAPCGEPQRDLQGPECAPRIEAVPATFDFGEVKEGDKPKASFVIRNAGDAELVIYDAKPSCGCTVAKLSARKLAPGETATLDAVYNSWNSSGTVYKYVELRSNDPRTPVISLAITGTVNADICPPGVPRT